MSRFDKRGRLIIPTDGVVDQQRKILVQDGNMVVFQAFCPKGHVLITNGNPKFNGEHGIKLLCEGETFSQIIYLSPMHNDPRKHFERVFKPGELLTIRCPVCEAEFPKLAPHDCQSGAMYHSIYLDQDFDVHNAINICNAWDCYSSFLRLFSEVITEIYQD